MLKRTLFFSNAYHLNTENAQLVAKEKESGDIKTVPIEDIGYIVLEHPHITFTQSVIQLLAENNTAVIFCNEKYMPSSMLLHLDTNTVQSELFRYQVSAGEPLKKQIWQQTIKAKISNQANLLEGLKDLQGFQNFKGLGAPLHHLAKQVKSGDHTNREAEASSRYWPVLFGKNFNRERFGKQPNPALNYGYTILRTIGVVLKFRSICKMFI
ncbi:MAG: type II CRISPR-associated endonuclease Cas1 [Flavobacteriales bacterium]